MKKITSDSINSVENDCWHMVPQQDTFSKCLYIYLCAPGRLYVICSHQQERVELLSSVVEGTGMNG